MTSTTRGHHVKLRTRVAGVSAATAVAMMGPSAIAQSAPLHILSGSTVNALLTVPGNACGVAAGILGFADAGCFDG